MVLPVQPVEYGVTVKQLLHTKAFWYIASAHVCTGSSCCVCIYNILVSYI